MRTNRISYLLDGNRRLDDRADITNHIVEFFTGLYSGEDWDRPYLDNLSLNSLSVEKATKLERGFEEETVRLAVSDLGGDSAQSGWFPDSFLSALLGHHLGRHHGLL
eukprot:TRINITY_DN33363_c1_g1_i1.p2 TRINITY_DN33363_c1_g1~~TRINITY_DN33363_c1_g1_i1.p2  ORF type:complete len:107 (+),score=7.79 TRINITY_DN33363_c1_g1_i1:744-1064(+)